MSTRCVLTEQEYRDRIMDSLLPAQREFVEDNETTILGFVAGFGAGKTRSLCAKICLDAMDQAGTVMAVFEPTAILLRDVFCRAFDDFLEEMEIDHDFRISPQPEYRLQTPRGETTLLCRATETWNRIRGQTLSKVYCDEIDTSPLDVSSKAVEMFLARLRGGTRPQLAMASTPEGYRLLYRLFVEEADKPDRRLIRAKTTDNPYLPEGFVQSLYDNYDPALIASYIEGTFTNLSAVTVYHPFDRDVHWTDEEIKDNDRLFIGIDFNVGACFCEVIVRRGDEFHVVREFFPKDTPAVCKFLKETFPVHVANENLVVIPDAASRQRSTANASESDLSLLKKANFIVKSQASNPAIEDRINVCNVLLLANRLKVHPSCKYLIKSMETQAYSKTGRPEKGVGGKDDVSGPPDAAGYALHHLAPLRRWKSGGSAIRVYGYIPFLLAMTISCLT